MPADKHPFLPAQSHLVCRCQLTNKVQQQLFLSCVWEEDHQAYCFRLKAVRPLLPLLALASQADPRDTGLGGIVAAEILSAANK